MTPAARAHNRLTNVAGQRRHRPDYQIVLYIGLLMLLGLIIMYAIGPQRAQVLNSSHGTDFYTSTYFVIKQTASLAAAIGAFVLMMLVPVNVLTRHAGKILAAGIGACVLLAFFGNIIHVESIVQCSLGACRWFELGPLGSFQPAELLKFGVLVFTAGFMGARIKQGLVNDVEKTIVPIGIIAAVSLVFTIIIQKDMGTGIALTAILASMFMVGGISRSLGLKLLVGILALGVLMIVIAPHRMERVTTFFQGDDAVSSRTTDGADDGNYHIRHAKIAIGTGGLFGVGIGNSVQATGYLPEAINDSVFAIMGETFGFVGLVVILMIFTALLMRILNVSDHLSDPTMRLIAAGVFGWLGAHVVLNVASMIGVFPLTGITLPLLSFGGTSMVFIAGALGLVFQLSRYTIHGLTTKERRYETTGSRRGLGGTRHPGRRGVA